VLNVKIQISVTDALKDPALQDVPTFEWPPGTEESLQTRLRFYSLLNVIDTHMSKIEDARMAWTTCAIAMGLPSVSGRSTTAIATEMGVSKQALSRPVTKFLRMSGLSPALGLKSVQARQAYRQCH
jgi:hypothetical protein